MTGKELKEAVWESGIKIKTLVRDSGIPEQTLYSLYKKQRVEEFYIKKLAKTGLGKFLPETIKSSPDPIVSEVQEAQEAYSPTMFSDMFSLMERMADGLLHDNDVFRRIIIKGLDKDAILFNTTKAGVTRKEIHG